MSEPRASCKKKRASKPDPNLGIDLDDLGLDENGIEMKQKSTKVEREKKC